jgi:hypothetical protein
MTNLRNGSAGYFGNSDQMQIVENRMIQITKGLNGEVEKTEEFGNEKDRPLTKV